MTNKNKHIGVTDIVLPVLALVLLIGLISFLKPCGPKEDGTWMTCHWAGRALTGMAGAVLVLTVLRLFGGGSMKLGLDMGIGVLALLMICVPGHLIGLCMMNTMRCRAVMAPGVNVLSILLVIAAAADGIQQYRRGKA